mmetsp:Transcript_4366/g.15415  ORF Transcript_4366/g.15415 Transcript_4366/m.15415 type:complete len:435 (+) Transcript_4366:1952-3256(+)
MLLRTPKPTMSASDLVHARLWRTLVVDALRDADLTTFGAYDASLAGLDWGLGAGARGVTLSFAGYVADQLASFVGVATKAMRDVDVLGYAALNGNLDRALDGIRRELQRDASTPPSTRAVNELALATERPKYAVSDQQAALDALSLKTFTAWLAEPVWDADRVDMLCSGNLDAAEARAVAKAALGGLGLAARGDGSYPAPHVALAPLKATGYTLLDVKAPNADETNYATLLTFQTGVGVEARALSLALAAATETSFYDSLRTKQQLGYIVQSTCRTRENASSVVFLAQSSRSDSNCSAPVDLTAAVVKFVDEDLPNILETLTTAQLKAFVDGLAKNLRERPKSLAGECTRSWDEIVSGRLDWRRRDREADALGKITPDDVRKFYAETLAAGGARRRPLLVQVDRGTRAGPTRTPPGAVSVDDVPAFRKSLEEVV